MGRGWRRALLAPLASLAAFAAVAAAVDRPAEWLRVYPAPLGPEDEPAVVGALVDFHLVYQDFFASGGKVDLLDKMPAVKEMRHQVMRDVGYVGTTANVLVLDLAGATLLDLSRTGRDAAAALVWEEWNWMLQRRADRAVVSQVKGTGQGFRYRLEREGGRWMIASWDLADVAPPADEGLRKW